jgi:Spy/CpxP family protein refolding chaperone
MKRIIVSVLAIALTITAVQAQEIPERKHDGIQKHEGHKRHHGKDMADLNLSEEQKANFKALNEDHRKQMAELKKQDNITVKESNERIETLRKEHHAKIQALLTTEQKAQLEKSKQERKTKMQERSKARGERMKEELNLTAEQFAKLDENRKIMSEKMKSIRDDKSLTEEQIKEKSKELRKQQRENMKSILTEEQLKKMQERKNHHHKRKTSV